MSDIRTPEEYYKYLTDGYAASSRQKKVNYLNYGRIGTGKTKALLTCVRKPLLVHSFDVTGTKSIRSAIDGRNVMVDCRFEQDDAMRPFAWALWLAELERMKALKIPSLIGTLAIDSTTNMALWVMNKVLKEDGRPGTWPQRQDYNPQVAQLTMALNEVLNFPCDVIINSHLTKDDDATGKTYIWPLLPGVVKERIPGNIDEVYVSHAESTSAGMIYKFQTKPDAGMYARSRLDEHGKLSVYEPADYAVIRAKLGYDNEV